MGGATEERIRHLADCARALCAQRAAGLGDAYLRDWPNDGAPLRQTTPSALPVLAWLSSACRAGASQAAEILSALDRASAGLAWRQTYAAEDFGPALLERYGWTELIGERGPIASARIAVGFLLLG